MTKAGLKTAQLVAGNSDMITVDMGNPKGSYINLKFYTIQFDSKTYLFTIISPFHVTIRDHKRSNRRGHSCLGHFCRWVPDISSIIYLNG